MKRQSVDHEENVLLEEPEVPWRTRYLQVLTRCMLIFSVLSCLWIAIFMQDMGSAAMCAALGFAVFKLDRLFRSH